jgi:hypothetical protein
LKHVEVATNDPFYITSAYAKTQLATIFQELDEEKKET